VLDQLRLGKLRPSERLVQAIFDSVDTLDVLIRQLETGGEDGHDRATQLTAQLEELLSAPTAEPSLTLDGLPLTPEVKDVLTEYEEARVLENLRGGKRIYEVTIPFNIENFEEALEQINQALKPLGELIARAPLPDAPTGYDLSCVILLASDADSHAIETAVERWNATVRDVMQGDGAPAAPMEVTVQAEVEEVKTPPTPAPSEAPAETPTPSKREPPVEEQPPVAQHHVAPTIRVDVQRLDRLLNLVGELVVIRSRYISLTRNLRDAFGEGELIEELERTNRFFNRRLDELRDGIFKARMIPIGQIFSRFPRVVRDVARVANKEVRLKMEGAETELDKAVVDAIVDPLVHLVRNAVDHGIESSEERVRAGKPRIGTIWLRARQEGNMILIEVADDGKGIDLERIRQRAIERGWLSPDIPITMREALEFLCQPGFSTATQITEISGRGVGLDVVKQVVETLGGTLDIESQHGAGTTFRI
ncbi:MAG TPA: hypothetical protein EYP10_00190, partial [Armatimonadetes bacterium]|nr:hypothetical protein [Armatimonadota bacterium]